MRYPASEKLKIIRLVEQSHLPVNKTLAQLGIAKTTLYHWYDRYQAFGEVVPQNRRPNPGRVWNRIPHDIRDQVVELALEEPDLSPRELAIRFTDTKRHYISETSAFRILKERDLVTSPAFVVIKAADESRDKTTRPNELWQPDFTYLKVTGRSWYYLSTILDDYSRYVVVWRLYTTIKARDITDTLEDALAASGCDVATVVHKPRLLSDDAHRVSVVI